MKTLTEKEREQIKKEMPQHIPHTPWKAVQAVRKSAPKPNEIGRFKRLMSNSASYRQYEIDTEPLLSYYPDETIRVVGKPFQGFVVLDYALERRTAPMKFWRAIVAAAEEQRGRANGSHSRA